MSRSSCFSVIQVNEDIKIYLNLKFNIYHSALSTYVTGYLLKTPAIIGITTG